MVPVKFPLERVLGFWTMVNKEPEYSYCMNQLKILEEARQWQRTPLIPRGQREEALCEFKASLVHRVSFRTARDTQRNPVSK